MNNWKLIFLVIFMCGSVADAAFSLKLDGGAYNGRIALTSGGSTVPLNTPVSTVGGGEIGLGWKRFKFFAAGSYKNYRAKTAGSTEYTEFNYGDYGAGFGYTTSCCEWKVLYMAAKTPYTTQPDPSTLTPVIVNANYLHIENVLSAKVPSFKLAFAYYLKYLLNAPEVSGGTMINNYYIGGCVRVLFMFAQHVGPSICVDLQELYLPQSTVVTRQEVSGRLTIQF